MNRRRNIFLSLKTVVSVFGWMGCEEFATEPIMCTKEMRPSIFITITDKDTGAKVTRSTITLQDGDYVETLTTTSTGAGGPANQVSGAWERKGNYDIIVSNPNYLTWLRRNIPVTSDECHVHTVMVTANLSPKP
tara:strand:+ start:237 stop:638 length:402 start_codon:yes stop_codon:yes gene_type:complete